MFDFFFFHSKKYSPIQVLTRSDPEASSFKDQKRSGTYRVMGSLGRKDTCICIAQSLCYLTKTITTLLMSYIPQYKIESYFLKKAAF